MKRFVLLLLVALLPVTAHAEGRDVFEESGDFLARVKTDLEKVDRSIDATKELLDKSADSELLPEIRLRLAELYVEKSRLLYYKALEERSGKKSNAALSVPEAKYFKERAIEQYQKILKEHKSFDKTDKVLFFLAHEYKELANNKEMLQTYDRLVKEHVRSEYVLESLLIVGNFYFDKSIQDEAEKRYKAILRRTSTGIAGMARYKLAWIALNKEDYKEALKYFEAAGKTPRPGPGDVQLQFEADKLKGVRRESLVDSVLPFTEVRKPKEALRYYEALAQDRFVLGAVIDKLANRYFIQEEFATSAQLYRRLLAMTRDSERGIEHARRLYDSEVKTKRPQWTARDVIHIADATHRFLTDWRMPAEDRAEVRKEYEAIVRDVATKVHIAAQKSKDRRKLAAAARGYQAYLEVFTTPGKFRTAIQENHAEALYESKQSYEAGIAFEKVAKQQKSKEAQFVHSSIASYQKVATDRDAGRFRRVQSREGIKQLGAYYISLYPDGKDVAKVGFQVARSYYDAGDYDRAIEEFDRYITDHPRRKESYAAAHLKLDALSRREDFEALAAEARRLMKDPRLPDKKFRTQVAKIVRNAEFRRVSDIIAETSGEEDFESRLLELASQNKGTELAEKALYNLYVTNRDRGDVEKTYQTGQRLLASYSKSDFIPEIVTNLSKISVDTANFSRAASYYEYYAKVRPKDREASKVLELAAQYRARLGHVGKAVTNYQRLAGRPGAPPKRKLLRDALEAAQSVGDWRRAAQAGRLLAKSGGDGPQARFAVGFERWNKGERATASKHFRVAVSTLSATGSDKDREAAGNAAFLLAEQTWRRYKALRIAGAEDAEGLQNMVAGAGQVEEAYAPAVGTGSGRWGVASLYRVGEAYQHLATAVRNVPPPDGLSGEEIQMYRGIIEQQVAPIEQKARATFAACVQKANELNVFSVYVAACATGGKQSPEREAEPPRPRRTRPPASLVNALRSDPGDVELLKQTARGHLAAGDPYTAELVARRALEQEESRGDIHSLLGVALTQRGAIQEASYAFQRAVEVAPDDVKVHVNLAAHYYAYGDPRRAKKALKKAGSLRNLRPTGPEAHPAARRMLADSRLSGGSQRRRR